MGGTLGTVTVTDGRGGIAGFSVSAISSAFAGSGTAAGDSSGIVTYSAGTLGKVGTNNAASSGVVNIVGVAPVVVGTDSDGNNTTSWTPTLAVAMPADSKAGTYTATLTTSLA
jgi:hypothetical protein